MALAAAPVRAQVSAVRLNEVLANNLSYTNANGSITDVLELYNTGAMLVDLTGCSLSDSNANPTRFIFPAGSSIAGYGFRRMSFTSTLPASTNNVNFGLKASGGNIFFYSSFDSVNYVDQIQYGLQTPDLSLGRVPDGTGVWTLNTPTLGATNVAVALGSPTMLKVNEWLADQTSSGPNDYFELYNPTNKPVALGGLYLTDSTNVPYQFLVMSNSFIGTGPYAYTKFTADGSLSAFPADHVNFSLKAGGEAVAIQNTNGAFIDVVTFGAQTKDVSQGRLPDGSTNIVSFVKINGYDTISPGAPNFLILTNILINELLSHTDPPLEDAVEVQNRATTNINISGWWLSNSLVNRKRYQIPNGVTLLPGRFRVIYEGVGSTNGFNSTNAASPFTFNSAHGDQVVLSQVDAGGNLTGYVMYELFETAANGVSFGHYDTTVPGDYKFVAMSARSFGDDDPFTVAEFRLGTGLTNPFPKVGPVVINEIMYAPSNTVYLNPTNNSMMLTNQNPAEEFIELRNITTNAVPLYDPAYPTNHWKFQKALDFVFPITNLAPSSFCLVVGFNPYTNTVALTNFRARFNVSSNVPIFGPWTGRLNDSGDSIELYRPDPVQLPPHPDAGYVPFVRVDKVNYSANAPWPPGSVGTGKTLQRKNSFLFGNDPINWASDTPNAGQVSLALQDTDGDGIPDLWEVANGLNPNSAADALLDPDGDGVNNLGEYLAGTNPHDSNSFLRVTQIIPFVGTNVPLYIRFLAYSNTTYTVEFRNSLLPTSAWQKLVDVNSAPTNRFVDLPDPNAYKKTDRYYRVVAPATN